MHRLLVALAALGLTFAALACGGGQNGSVTYAPTVVPIKHLGLKDASLTVADIFNPPAALVDRYPATVATVNGKPITGKSLATEEIAGEIGRRNQDPDLATQAQTKPQMGDALESVIDGELLRQAVERLGLLPSHEEAVAYTSKQSFARRSSDSDCYQPAFWLSRGRLGVGGDHRRGLSAEYGSREARKGGVSTGDDNS